MSLSFWLSPLVHTPEQTIPDLVVLRQYGVLRPILLWLATSVILPFIGAHLIVFVSCDQNQVSSEQPKEHVKVS